MTQNNEQVVNNQNTEGSAVLKVVGAGGGGNNAVKRMRQSGLQGVELIAVNTDKQALAGAEKFVDRTIAVGDKLTRGLGAGANPEVGRKACEESEQSIREALEGICYCWYGWWNWYRFSSSNSKNSKRDGYTYSWCCN
jgi:cell division GTPase FtsZ